jgi:hypothetical protein
LICLTAGIVLGVPFFYRQLLISAYNAQRLALIAATGAPDQDAAVAAVQTLSLLSAINIVFTPVGFLIVYLTGSAALRLFGAYIGEPSGDPVLAFVDMLMRHVRRRLRVAWSAMRDRADYGPQDADQVMNARDVDYAAGADVVVIASRPKVEWAAGTVVLSDDGYYSVLNPFVISVDGHKRIVYPLKRKRDFEIIRKAFRYNLRQ